VHYLHHPHATGLFSDKIALMHMITETASFPYNLVSRYQKVKPFCDFNEARDDRVEVASARLYANLHLPQER